VYLLIFRLAQVDVSSLEDVYWLEDVRARSIVGKDFSIWTAARQALPTSKDDLENLKADLWSAVVKNSQHEDAWTWGKHIYIIKKYWELFYLPYFLIYF